MSVKIDKYVQIVDESGLIGWIRDESNEKVIIKIINHISIISKDQKI